MSRVVFESVLAKQMKQMVALKRIEGYDYTAQAVLLRYFDRFLSDQDWSRQRLSSEVLQRYVSDTKEWAPNTRVSRLAVARVFSRFLHAYDPSSAILQTIPVKRPSQPRFYLYHELEVQALLAAARRLGPAGAPRPFCFHMLIGLIAVTGPRISSGTGGSGSDTQPPIRA